MYEHKLAGGFASSEQQVATFRWLRESKALFVFIGAIERKATTARMPSVVPEHDEGLQEEQDLKAEASRLRAAIDESVELRDEIQQKNIK